MGIAKTERELVRQASRKSFRLQWQTVGVPLAILTLAATFGVLNPRFTQLSNLANIGRQIASTGLVAWGQTMVILTAGIDLSVGSVAALVSVVSATVIKNQGTGYGILAGILVGTLAGLVNGFFIGKVRLPPFVVTLAMMSIARGAAMTYTGGVPVFGFESPALEYVGQQSLAGIPVSTIVAIIGFMGVLLILTRTRFGLALYAIGGSEPAALLAGIPVTRYLITVYTLSGFLAGVGGVLLTGRMNSGQPLIGSGLELQSIAAVCIGGTSLFGGRGSVVNTAFGLMLVGMLTNGLDILGISSFIQQIIIGVVILVSVLVSLGRR
jgi:ribose/xylose/arabinose/galactoside ABC-type transport system permease subunit